MSSFDVDNEHVFQSKFLKSPLRVSPYRISITFSSSFPLTRISPENEKSQLQLNYVL